MKENQETQAAKPQKIKKSYAFWPEVAQMIENHKYVHDGKEIAFVTQAIKNYCAEIDGEKNLDVLVNRMYKIVSAEAENQADRMASLLFKIAVEIAILNYTISAGYVNMDDDEMQYIRNRAINNVQKSHGIHIDIASADGVVQNCNLYCNFEKQTCHPVRLILRLRADDFVHPVD